VLLIQWTKTAKQGGYMKRFANVGDFCPNEVCSKYGKLQEKESKPNIKKYGFTPGGVQRYQCLTCKQTFTATKGTIFYRRRTDASEILETLAFLAEGVRISTLSHVKGHKEDTILDWLREAARHVAEIEAVLLANYQLERGQLDAMWSYVGNKGEKRITRKRKKAVSFGERP
jgi:transposase-like protein